MRHRRHARNLLACLFAALASACGWGPLGIHGGDWLGEGPVVEGRFERTLDVSGPADLEVHTGAGTIDVRVGPEGRVHIVGRIRASAERSAWNGVGGEEFVEELEAEPPVEQAGNTVIIGGDRWPDLLRSARISYDIIVPPDTRVEAHSGSGDQQLEGPFGSVDARTGSGDIRVRTVHGSVEARTGSGGIDAEGVTGGLVARAGSGTIRGTDVGGSVSARTGSGRVELMLAPDAQVDVTTGSGAAQVSHASRETSVRVGSGSLSIDGRPEGPWRLSAGSGRMAISLPADAAFDLDARAGSGGITIDHPLTPSRDGGDRRRLEGTVRGGGPLVRVRTGSGGVRIQQQ